MAEIKERQLAGVHTELTGSGIKPCRYVEFARRAVFPMRHGG
jgi:hypothetical protein